MSVDASENKIPLTAVRIAQLNNPDFPKDLFDYGSTEAVYQSAAALLRGATVFASVDPSDFIAFGQKSSHTYRRDFMLKTKDLTPDAKLGLILLFTAVKNKNRVMSEMRNMNIIKYPWVKELMKFVSMNMVQYTSELERMPSAFAGVHVPHILPSVTTICWIMINTKVSSTNYLENLWACQMKLPDDIKKIQMEWEVNFWDNVVKGTRSENRNTYVAGFQESFWRTKASDEYPFLTYNSEEFEVLDSTDLDCYLSLMQKFKPDPSKKSTFMLTASRIREYSNNFKDWMKSGYNEETPMFQKLKTLSDPTKKHKNEDMQIEGFIKSVTEEPKKEAVADDST